MHKTIIIDTKYYPDYLNKSFYNKEDKRTLISENQLESSKNGNTVFVDKYFEVQDNQLNILTNIKRMKSDEIYEFIDKYKEDDRFLILPRDCLEKIQEICEKSNVKCIIKDKKEIGQCGASKEKLNGKLDVASFQSLFKKDNIEELVKNYGLVIVDECHHVAAFSFEKVLKAIRSKYVYGLTATPTRKDGWHKIIYMQCGDIRFRV